MWCNITGEAAGEIWTWSLLGEPFRIWVPCRVPILKMEFAAGSTICFLIKMFVRTLDMLRWWSKACHVFHSSYCFCQVIRGQDSWGTLSWWCEWHCQRCLGGCAFYLHVRRSCQTQRTAQEDNFHPCHHAAEYCIFMNQTIFCLSSAMLAPHGIGLISSVWWPVDFSINQSLIWGPECIRITYSSWRSNH